MLCQTVRETRSVSTSGSSPPLTQGDLTHPSSQARGCPAASDYRFEVGPDLCAILLASLQDEEEAHYSPTSKAELLSHLSPISLGVTCRIQGFGEVMAQYLTVQVGGRREQPATPTPRRQQGAYHDLTCKSGLQ